MSVRNLEDHMLCLCLDVAQGRVQHVTAPVEANAVAALAVFLSENTHFCVKQRLQKVSQEYFIKHPEQKMMLKEVMQQSWCLGLPRFKDMFVKYLQFEMQKNQHKENMEEYA